MKNSRKHIAAGVTVVALGALATVALASDGTQSTNRSAPQVRTETVHRSAEHSATTTATPTPTPTAVHQRRGRGADDAAGDDHGGRGRGDDSGSDDHGGSGRGGDNRGSGDHGGGHGHGGHDD